MLPKVKYSPSHVRALDTYYEQRPRAEQLDVLHHEARWERAAVVAWLRDSAAYHEEADRVMHYNALSDAADAIEQGGHHA